LTLLAVLSTAVVVLAASVLVGHGLRRLSGYDEFSWTAAPIGLASLLVLAAGGVALPGHAVTGFVLIAAAVAASLVAAARGRSLAAAGRASPAVLYEAAVVGLLALAAGCLPFLASGRVGVLGVTDNADLGGHLVLADAVGHGRDPVGLDPSWWPAYPTGPHALAAALSRGLGIRLDAVFGGLLLAAVAVTALGALAALRDLRRWRRAVGAVLAALPFLVASYVIQSSFKEPLEIAFLTGWAFALPEVAERSAARRRAVIPLAMLAAACFATFSMVGLVWPAAVTVAWVALRLLARERPLPPVPRGWALGSAGLFVVVFAAAALPHLDRASKFFGGAKAAAGGATTGGNVRADVPAYEVAGLWPEADFRTLGEHPARARVLGIAGLAVAAWAGWWCWTRRRLEPLALAAGGVAVYAPARLFATPYYGAKALTIVAAGVMLMSVTAVLGALPPLAAPSGVRPLLVRPLRVAGVAAGIAFLAFAAWSSSLALRAGRVAPADHERELESLRATVRGQPTLYMGENDYIAWQLRGARLAFPYSYLGRSQIEIVPRPEKPWAVTRPFDFDSVASPGLDRFRYAIATRAGYASEPPANWRRIRTTPSFALYERVGPTPPRAILPEGSAPGAGLDCESSRPAGSDAAVMAQPSAVEPAGLRLAPGNPAPRGQYGFVSLETGAPVFATFRLPPGRYELSAQYLSPTPLRADAAGARLRAPASLEGPGTFWRLGGFRSPGGDVRVRLRTDRSGWLARFRTALVGTVAVSRAGGRDRLVPMPRACGRYVDWYRPR
jgi:hypothetical protein